MDNPWKHIDLSDYERHMSDPGVGQLQAFSRILREQLADWRPASLCMLGGGPGAGLEHADSNFVRRVYLLDINESYLAESRSRHPKLAGILETRACDLGEPGLMLPDCDLMEASLFIEYIGVETFAALVRRNLDKFRVLSCTIQKSNANSFVSASPTAHKLAILGDLHHDVEEEELTAALEKTGLRVVKRKVYDLPNGKEFIRVDFSRNQGKAE
ncbi:MAG: methyltransferase type 11 [Deltaproteobacteria bacterium]|jgi:hypothetical protein|nr:methyltransferase type 11 [Deltaproteobacteria bacterium]